jgi:diguanylate cyclase (GGDEF)-like protein
METTPAALPFELDRLVFFSESLIDAVVHGSLHQVLKQRLPPLLGTSQVWLLTEENGWQNLIVGSDAPDLLSNTRTAGWESFVLWTADRKRVGLLGVGAPGGVSPEQRQVVELVCRLIATALISARHYADVRELSTLDPLSGCLLKHAAISRLAAELVRAERTRQPLTIVVFAIDDFIAASTELNGDRGAARIVVRIGKLLQKTLRVSDIRCRIAPGQFLLVLPDTGFEGGKRAVEHLGTQLHATESSGEEETGAPVLRAGIAQARTQETDPEAFIERALKSLRTQSLLTQPAVQQTTGPSDTATHVGSDVAVSESPFPGRAPNRRSSRFPGRRRTDFDRHRPSESTRQRPI